MSERLSGQAEGENSPQLEPQFKRGSERFNPMGYLIGLGSFLIGGLVAENVARYILNAPDQNPAFFLGGTIAFITYIDISRRAKQRTWGETWRRIIS